VKRVDLPAMPSIQPLPKNQKRERMRAWLLGFIVLVAPFVAEGADRKAKKPPKKPATVEALYLWFKQKPSKAEVIQVLGEPYAQTESPDTASFEVKGLKDAAPFIKIKCYFSNGLVEKVVRTDGDKGSRSAQ
jgi:hypothetical protein